MPFSSTGFSTIGASKAGNAPSMYTYKTADSIDDVNTTGYFNAIASTLSVGDVIICHTSTGGSAAVSLVWVNSNTGTVVDVTNGLAVTATDSD